MDNIKMNYTMKDPYAYIAKFCKEHAIQYEFNFEKQSATFRYDENNVIFKLPIHYMSEESIIGFCKMLKEYLIPEINKEEV